MYIDQVSDEASVPSPPRNLMTVKVYDSSIRVTWQVPQSDGNSPITGYVVEVAEVSGRTYTTVGHTNSDTLEFTLDGLEKDKQYLVRLFAENAIGRSEPVLLHETATSSQGESVDI